MGAPLSWKRNLVILWLGCFLTACSFSLVMPFLPRFVGELGVREHVETWAGVIFGITFLFSAIMSPVWGNLADRWGRKPMIIRSGISIAAIYILMSFVTNHYQLLGLRMLNGVFSGFIPSAIALVATNTPDANMARSLAILQTGMASGQIMGPLIGGALSDLLGIRPSMQVAAGLMLVATVLIILGVREGSFARDEKRTNPLQDISMAVRNPVLLPLLIAVTMVSASIMSLEPILTLFVGTLRHDPAVTWAVRTLLGRESAVNLVSGFIFSLPAIAMILAAARWADVGRRIGFPRLLSLALLGAGLFVLPQSLVTTASQLIFLRFAFGLCTAASQPSVNATIALAVPASFRGRAYGILASTHFIGGVIGPVMGGYIGSTLGHRAVFVTTGVLLITAAFWINRTLVRQAAQSESAAAAAH
jgi:MFS transporter, DHA1 family, multidrug resistance protein